MKALKIVHPALYNCPL